MKITHLKMGQVSGWPSRHRENGIEYGVIHLLKILSKKNFI